MMKADLAVRFGRAVRKLRQAQKMSQEELAERCGLHRTYISDIELGKRNVSLENIGRLAAALNRPLPDFFKDVE